MDQDHVYLKNYQNVNLDLIWVFKSHNFTLELHRQRAPCHLSHSLVNCTHRLSLLLSHFIH